MSQLTRELENRTLSPACSKASDQLTTEIPFALDDNDVAADTCGKYKVCNLSHHNTKIPVFSLFNLNDITSSFYLNSPLDFSLRQHADTCLSDKVTAYLNRKDVQEALHAQLVGV